MNPSGGLLWHWRAVRSRALWAPTCERLADWLGQVQPMTKSLLLLGPSAGWMLPTSWLLRFKDIHAVDLDPLAPALFGWRHGRALTAGGTNWRYSQGDGLIDLPHLLTAHPRACVLFDNVLGQLRFHAPSWQDPQEFTRRSLTQIRWALRDREWGSVHDLLSGPAQGLPAGQPFPAAPAHGRTSLENQATQTGWLAAAGPQGKWLDHLTSEIFEPGTLVQNIAWPFRSTYWHWLQAGWVQPTPAFQKVDASSFGPPVRSLSMKQAQTRRTPT